MAQPPTKPFYHCIGYVIRKAKHPPKIKNTGPLVLIKINSHDKIGRTLAKGRSLGKSSLGKAPLGEGGLLAIKAKLPCFISSTLKKNSSIFPQGARPHLKTQQNVKVGFPAKSRGFCDLKKRVSWLNFSKVKILDMSELRERDSVEEEFRRVKLVQEGKRAAAAGPKAKGKSQVVFSGNCRLPQDQQTPRKHPNPQSKKNKGLQEGGVQSTQAAPRPPLPSFYNFTDILSSSANFQRESRDKIELTADEPNYEKVSQRDKYEEMKKSSAVWKKPTTVKEEEKGGDHSSPNAALRNVKEALPLIKKNQVKMGSEEKRLKAHKQRLSKGVEITKKEMENQCDHKKLQGVEAARKNRKPQRTPDAAFQKTKVETPLLPQIKEPKNWGIKYIQLSMDSLYKNFRSAKELSVSSKPFKSRDKLSIKPITNKLQIPQLPEPNEKDSQNHLPKIVTLMKPTSHPSSLDWRATNEETHVPRSAKFVELSKYGFVKSYLEGLASTYVISQPTILTDRSQSTLDVPSAQTTDLNQPETLLKEKVFRFFNRNNPSPYPATDTDSSMESNKGTSQVTVDSQNEGEKSSVKADNCEPVSSVEKILPSVQGDFSMTTFDAASQSPSKIVLFRKPELPTPFKSFGQEEKEAIKKALGASITNPPKNFLMPVENPQVPQPPTVLMSSKWRGQRLHPIDIVKLEATKQLDNCESTQLMARVDNQIMECGVKPGLQEKFNQVIEGFRKSCEIKKKIEEEKVMKDKNLIHDAILSSIVFKLDSGNCLQPPGRNGGGAQLVFQKSEGWRGLSGRRDNGRRNAPCLKNPFSTGRAGRRAEEERPNSGAPPQDRPCLANPFEPRDHKQPPQRPPGAHYNPFEIPLGKSAGRPCSKNPFWSPPRDAGPGNPSGPGGPGNPRGPGGPSKGGDRTTPRPDPNNPFKDLVLETLKSRMEPTETAPSPPNKEHHPPNKEHHPPNTRIQFGGEWRKRAGDAAHTPEPQAAAPPPKASGSGGGVKILPVSEPAPLSPSNKVNFVLKRRNDNHPPPRNDPCPKKAAEQTQHPTS